MSRYLGLGAVLGALFALTSVAAAGEDTMRLDLKKSSKTALTGGVGAAGQFTHDARAKASDDDVEDVFFGYSRGYLRGASGLGYVVPRFYRFRAGYYAGAYGGGWRPFYGYYGGYRGYYPWFRGGYYSAFRPYYGYGYGLANGYSVPVYSYVYTEPSVTYVEPIGGSGANAAPTNTLRLAPTLMPMPTPSGGALSSPLPPPRANGPGSKAPLPLPLPLPLPNEPAPKTRPNQPMPPAYQYDGPTGPQPSYRYDGGPSQTVPMPPADLNPSGPTPKGQQGDGRVVKFTPPSKKLAYPAYGDNRRKADSGRTIVVKKSAD